MVVLILNLINIFMTIAHRVETKLYVSLWYISGTVIWMPALYFLGNVMWNPPTGALTGINDTIIGWFYGHNVLGLWFTTGLLSVVYFVVPKETHTPLYSHFLSLIAFWGIVFFYTGVGAHHLLWAPIPYWLKTIAVADSIGMILPVVAFTINIYPPCAATGRASLRAFRCALRSPAGPPMRWFLFRARTKPCAPSIC